MKMRDKIDGGCVVAVIYIAICLAAVFGWGRCVYKFSSCDFSKETSYKAEIVYGVGVFTGAGVIIGYFDFGK